MKILLLGTGAREHALAVRLSQSSSNNIVYWARPNAAPTPSNILPAEVTPDSPEDVKKWCQNNSPDLVVAGGESPLCSGVGDAVRQVGIPFFGPSKSAAMLEGSKIFAKNKMLQWGVPTAAFTTVEDVTQALRFLEAQSDGPWVIKADGLAAGKGSVVAMDKHSAIEVATDMLVRGKFGDAGRKIIIEEFLQGEEFSVHCLISAGCAEMLPVTQDHKRVGDDDTGPNTGGMGAYGPVPQVTPDIISLIQAKVLDPILAGMAQDGMDYRGILYIGIMLTNDGPKVLEFNCRFGDPECQVLMQLVGGDLAQIFLDTALGKSPEHVPIRSGSAACVVLASEGYPSTPRTGELINGLETPSECIIYHAATRRTAQGVVTAGGRVLSVVCYQPTLEQALQKIYAHIPKIHFNGMHYRKDIGHRALKWLTASRTA